MRSVRLALLVLSCSSPATVFAQTIQEQASRPPPLPPEVGCELWRGAVSGNDPSVLVEARLCPEGDRVRGVLQWSSTRSGWNRRSIEGAWDAGRTHLTMRDLAVVEQRPQPGWVFCPVDHYDLTRPAPVTLTGTYDSAACRDHATVSLTLVSTDVARPAEVPPTPATPPTPTPPPPPPAAPTGCSARCDVASTTTARWPAAAVAVLVVLVLHRRARRMD